MADRRKKAAKQKAVTVTSAPAPKKKRGKEKKPTLSAGTAVTPSELEKPSAKPVKQKQPARQNETPLGAHAAEQSPERNKNAGQVPLLPQEKEKPTLDEQPQTMREPPAVSPASDKTAGETPPAKTSYPPRRINVLFVCTGNTCRSAMAQYIFADFVERKGMGEYFDVRGAGLSALNGDDMSEQAKQVLFEKGIREVNHFARRLTREMVEASDLVVCMTEGHFRTIGAFENVTTVARITGGADVSDPWGGSLDDYRKVAAYLEYACGDVYDAALKAVRAQTGGTA